MNDRIDDIDLKIIELLQQDCRQSHKEIGEKVHRTGQAVGVRINHLIDQNIIQSYTVKIQYQHKQFIQLFLNDHYFAEIESIVQKFDQIDEFYKIMGDACYMVVAHFDPMQLVKFIEGISIYCRYSVSTVLREVKA
ncbi:Lrp/AsnC family transcriptional regulator [Acinetobacter populi]|uniref:AsnC family protein n=1 Tax=Acinetobacter populi TaxID=1582270 RepID=A0A1Z9YVY3_9GAMM|nr:AsnC family transcriptional regulator [Acinetobacter populi]OUY06406.1 AsnC family protein [Acinetobacter populi]